MLETVILSVSYMAHALPSLSFVYAKFCCINAFSF